MQCRVFLKTPENRLKKIYSIRAKGKFIQAQIMSNLLCKQFGIPLGSEIHYQCPSNGKDIHLSIKYVDRGPFDDPNIVTVENYISIFSSRECYKHKQVIKKINSKPLKHIHYLPLHQDMRIKSMVGYFPESFETYLKNEAIHPIYYFPTVGTSITPLSTQELDKRPWEKGDRTKTPPTDSDIVIEESYESNAYINVCGFFCSPGHYPTKEETKHNSKFLSSLGVPDIGISVIFS